MNNNYTLLHLHSDYSLLDSTTSFERYVDWAVEHGMKAIASTEHGNIYNWTTKKEYCDKKGIKYIHGVELYLTEKLFHTRLKIKESKDGSYEINEVKQKIRDNYHIILLARNFDGVKEINSLVSMANDENHFYFKPRISFEEASKISHNVIVLSACLANPLWSYRFQFEKYQAEVESLQNDIANLKEAKNNFIKELNGESTIRKKKRAKEKIEFDIKKCEDYIEAYKCNIEYLQSDIDDINMEYFGNDYCLDLINRYDYFEVQPHVNSEAQKEFNKKLLEISKENEKPIICGTDTHNYDSYAAECRTIMQVAKGIEFLEEDTFDLTLKTYDELYDMFKEQNVLTNEQIHEVLDNTNKLADNVEDFELDVSFKYPVFKSPEEDAKMFENKCWQGLDNKIKIGAIDKNKYNEYSDRVKEELRVFNKIGMSGFMLSMEEFIGKLRNEGIPFGFSRGSCFTKDAIVHTIDGLKTIDTVCVCDKVLSANGEFNTVYDTASYDICEDMIEIEHYNQGSCKKKYNNLCTLDHRILINRNGNVDYIQAQDIKPTDLLCYPVIHNTCTDVLVIDLNKYNIFGYKYDDNYIYEEVETNVSFPYSRREMERKHIFSRSTLKSYLKDKNSKYAEKAAEKLRTYTPFPTFQHYDEYLKSHEKIYRKIPRFIKLDALTNAFIGLMYGDGWTNREACIGLAINNTSKNVYNRYVLENFAKKTNTKIYYNKSKTKDLVQGYIYSKIITQWFMTDFFKSKRGKCKTFNSYLFNQPTKYLKFLLDGLTRSDGSVVHEGQISFDNISLSIIGAYRYLYNVVCNNTLALDIRLEHKDSRGWINSESYKLRGLLKNKKILHDDNYYYLPITKIIRHKDVKTTVYDLSVYNNPSFVVNNMIVHNCGGSVTAYLTDITDCDPLVWNLSFERFCNENRVSLGD